MPTETNSLKLVRLNSELLLKTKAYFEAIKDDKTLEEVKQLRLEMKNIEQELKDLMSQQK